MVLCFAPVGLPRRVLCPVAADRLAGAGLVDSAQRVCTYCSSGAAGDEMHIVECAALAPLRQRCASLFNVRTDTMRSLFAQQDHSGISHYVVDCLDVMNM